MNEADRLKVCACINDIGRGITDLSALFYANIYRFDPNIINVLDGQVPYLQRKFANMLATLNNVKYIDKVRPALEKMSARHMAYGAHPKNFKTFRSALLQSLADYFAEKDQTFDDDLRAAWEAVFDEVTGIMRDWMLQHPELQNDDIHDKQNTHRDTNLLKEIGGEEIIRRVHQRFYNVLFEDNYLGQFFYGKSKPSLIMKQTQFMVAAFGGEDNYRGGTPAFVHMHMLVTDEMADIRETILRRTILAEGLSEDIADRWLSVDHAFRPSIVKKSEDECVMRCWGQAPSVIKKPAEYSIPTIKQIADTPI
ncbi:MAG: globin domain-containing protein [Mariprofundales bacterium]